MKIWLIGAGPHAIEHARVLMAQNIDFEVIGRGEASAKKFKEVFGINVFLGGIDKALVELGCPEKAIISVSFEELASVAEQMILAGTKSLLLEKPGGINLNEINRIDGYAEQHNVDVYIAYNRRFYASTIAAKQLIEKEGGALSCLFEFTEWSNIIKPMSLPKEVKSNWVLANSSHVIDLAFYLSGQPKELANFNSGGLSWHKISSKFSGAGVTNQGATFAYHANWDSPGRWSVEVMTKENRYIFRPMEQLHINPKESVSLSLVELDYSLDETFKPGLYLQTKAFLKGNYNNMCSLKEQVNNALTYSRIAGYIN